MLALTGGIGAGKSEALRAFADLGAAVLSSDEVVHRLYREPGVRAAVRARFGDEVIAGGAVDRAALGRRVFGDREAVAFLERLLHPRIGAERERWVAERRADDPPPPVLVCEVPLLFEAGLADRFDGVLVITAPEATRRQRVERRGQDYEARSGHQLPEDRKVAAADHAYVNDGSLDDLRAWAAAVVAAHAPGGGGDGRS